MKSMHFVVLTQLFAAGWAATGAQSQEPPRHGSQPFRIALSVSPFPELILNAGTAYTDGVIEAASVKQLEELFKAHGANELYARIATCKASRGPVSDHSLEQGLRRAQLARELDLPFNPELGLFSTYGDITHQPSPDFSEYPEIALPGPWTSLTLDQMRPILRQYGALVAREILDTGVKVCIWDIGNEVEFGVAGVATRPLPGWGEHQGKDWYQPPDAIDPEIGRMSVLDLIKMPEPDRIEWLREHIWPNVAGILGAVADGVRSVDPAARFSTHASGGLPVRRSMAVAFYQALKDHGFLPDELGFSFYPSSPMSPPQTLRDFCDTITAVRRELRRPVFIAEYSYPAKPMHEGPFASWNCTLPGYPLTPEGQHDLLRDIASWGAAGNLSGIRPWAPDGAMPGWDPMALFNVQNGRAGARPALDAIAEGVATPDADALKAEPAS